MSLEENEPSLAYEQNTTKKKRSMEKSCPVPLHICSGNPVKKTVNFLSGKKKKKDRVLCSVHQIEAKRSYPKTAVVPQEPP